MLRRTVLGWLLLGIGLLSAVPAAGQAWVSPRYVHEVWTTAEGLPVNAINDLLQAQDGYLWLATFDGLVRFDGVRFTVFTVSTTPGLPSNRIARLYETANGHLWLVTVQGHLVRFDGQAFHASAPRSAHAPLHQAPDGRLWTGTPSGFYVMDETLRRADVPALGIVADVEAVLQEADGTLWAGTAAGLHRFTAGQWQSVETPSGASPGTVLALYEDEGRPGTVWVGTQDGLFVYRAGTLNPVPGTAGLREVRALFRDAQGTLSGYGRAGFFTYQDGQVERLNPEDVELEDLYPKRGVVAGPSGTQWAVNGHRLYENGARILDIDRPFTSIVRDHEGSLWMASSAGGLHRLKPALFTTYGEAEGLRHPITYGLSPSADGGLWVATLGGWVSHLGQGEVTRFTNGSTRIAWTVLEDRAGALWVGGPSGLWRCQPPALLVQDAEMACVEERLADGAEVTVRALYEDRAGTLWVGTTEGLYRLQNGRPVRLSAASGVPDTRFLAFHEAPDGALWMATYAGIVRYQDGRFERFTTADGLSSDHVRALYVDPDGVLWAGTEDQGLNRLDLPGAARLQDVAVTVYRQADGLFDDGIHTLLDDGDGRFWMSTNRGLFWVHRAALDAFSQGETARVTVQAYDERDGMRNREANGGVQTPALQTPDGRLWFATQGGVVSIDPRTVQSNTIPPPVAIEAVLAAGHAQSMEAGYLVLPPSVRDFDIAYTGLSFAAPEHMRFRYRLVGLNDTWTEVDRRTAFFTNVPPGTYTFEVTASNNDGYWNREGAALTVVLEPYFYETRSFYALIGVGVLLLLGLGYQRRIRQVQARADELEALVTERTEALVQETETVARQAEQLRALDAFKSRFFANLSHEFRTPLTLIIGPLQRALAGEHGPLPSAFEPEGRIMLRNSQRLQRLINQILDLAQMEDGSLRLDARVQDLVPFLGEIVEAFGPLAREAGVTLSFKPVDTACVALFDADRLEKVILNLLSNAFKVSRPGDAVTVTVAPDGDDVEIGIADTGPGIPAANLPHLFDRFYQVDASSTRTQEGSGIGLALAKELVDLHGGTLTVESEVGVGSTFTVRLPARRTADAGLPLTAVPRPDGDAPGPPAVMPGGDGLPASTSSPTLGQAAAPGTEDDDRTTVLVVEDNADMRDFVGAVLGTTYRVLTAPDGASGLAEARAHLPDLIVSDVMMPGLDGFALGRALKDDPALDCIPVILLTARAEVEDQVEGYETGADAYVTKPFEASVLRAQVRALLDTRLRLRTRFAEGAAPPEESTPAPSETPFVAAVRAAVLARMADPALTVEDLAAAVNLSYVQCYRRLRDEAGLTPSAYIRTLRLERAAALLEDGAGTVSEIAYGVGFNSLSYFSRCFREAYGVAPSGYAARA